MVLGLGLMLITQAFVNMGVAVGIFPVTGQPLPLVSMGGTSILFTCLAMGAILSVSRHNQEEKEKKLAKEKGEQRQ
jgi:cell division protein FtsW